MRKFVFFQPGKVIFKEGITREVGSYASKFGSKALVVTGRRFAMRSGYLNLIKESLESHGLKVEVFNQVEPNPSVETVNRGSRIAKEIGAEVIVAFGGGSPMDAAKGIAVATSLGRNVEEFLSPKVVENEVIPVIAIPTTSGTGSEVTKYSVLTYKGKKAVLVGDPIIPKVALLDPQVTYYMPPELSAWTGFDALSHAIEAYISRKSSPLSDLFAVEAIRIITSELSKSVKGDKKARADLHYASMLAGVAINHAGTTMVHGIGYYLTTEHGVQHGLANAMMLLYVLEYYSREVGDKLSELARRAGLGENWKDLIMVIARIEDEVNIPDSISDLKVSLEEVNRMAFEALTYDRNLKNGPVVPSLEEVKAICMKAIRGRREFLKDLIKDK